MEKATEEKAQRTTLSNLGTGSDGDSGHVNKIEFELPKRYDEKGGAGFPTVKCGADAELDYFRSSDRIPESIEKGNVATQEEFSLFFSHEIQVTWTDGSDLNHGCQKKGFENMMGKLYITSKRLFFVASCQEYSMYDFAIDAACISLHAMASEPQWNVYCQLTEEIQGICWNHDEDSNKQEIMTIDMNNDKGQSPIEIFFMPIEAPEKTCQSLFRAMTKLATLNPVKDDDDDEDWYGNANAEKNSACGSAAMAAAITAEGAIGIETYHHDEDDLVYRVDSIRNSDDREAVESERRQQMLNRLDNMLLVPPEYEIQNNSGKAKKRSRSVEGQFDDADEEIKDINRRSNTNHKIESDLSSTKKVGSTNAVIGKLYDGGQFDDAEDDLL